MKKTEKVIHIKDDFTAVMNKSAGSEQTINKENRQALSGNRKLSKNKKKLITIVSLDQLKCINSLLKERQTLRKINSNLKMFKTAYRYRFDKIDYI